MIHGPNAGTLRENLIKDFEKHEKDLPAFEAQRRAQAAAAADTDTKPAQSQAPAPKE